MPTGTTRRVDGANAGAPRVPRRAHVLTSPAGMPAGDGRPPLWQGSTRYEVRTHEVHAAHRGDALRGMRRRRHLRAPPPPDRPRRARRPRCGDPRARCGGGSLERLGGRREPCRLPGGGTPPAFPSIPCDTEGAAGATRPTMRRRWPAARRPRAAAGDEPLGHGSSLLGRPRWRTPGSRRSTPRGGGAGTISDVCPPTVLAALRDAATSGGGAGRPWAAGGPNPVTRRESRWP